MRVTYQPEYERRIRLCAIGCGGHAQRNIFPTYQYAPVDLVAVCDLDRSRAEACARMWGPAAVYTDHREMLEREQPDAVVIVTNYDAEGRPRYPVLAMDVMRQGAHAWIEKPPAASSDEILQMMAVSRETGKFVGVGFKKMFAPANRKAKEILSRPEFGPLSSLTARYPQPLPPPEDRADSRKTVGFLDHIVHPYSVIHYLGGPIESLYVERNDRTGASITSIRFTSGAVGSLHLAHGSSGMSPLERTELVGRGANVVVENNLRVTYYRPGGPEGGYGRAGTFYADEEKAPLFWEPEFSLGQLYNKGLFLLGYAPEILYFCDCVLENRPPEVGSLDDALEILRIYEAYCRTENPKLLPREGG
ncbi:MAG: Gfo/Idh/MocA family oxidoreductase [Armatimonadetes bacterium]|nr:Gfo/Idh/MocA family oxidoreductase [Armatimonadota bacterium]